MPTLTDPEIIASLHDFNQNVGNGIAFKLVMQQDNGSYKAYIRCNQPCWGELRTYNTKDDGYDKPGDLHHPFPKKGNPVAVAAYFRASYNYSDNATARSRFLEWLFSSESPWASAFGDTPIQLTRADQRIKGIVLTDTKVDPTVFVQTLLLSKNFDSCSYWCELVGQGVHPTVAFLLSHYFDGGYVSHCPDTYTFGPKIDPWRFWNSKPHNLTPGETLFYDRGNYNRPQIHNTFKGPLYIPKEVKAIIPNGIIPLETMTAIVAPQIQGLLSEAREDPANIEVWEKPDYECDDDGTAPFDDPWEENEEED